MSSTFVPDSLEDPQFVPGENIGTGNGEPVLASPTRPGEALTEFGELVGETFNSAPVIAGLFLIAIVWTVILVIVALQAVMSTLRIQRMVGDIGRNDTELLAAYLARNKKADKAVDDEMASYPEDFESVFAEDDKLEPVSVSAEKDAKLKEVQEDFETVFN